MKTFSRLLSIFTAAVFILLIIPAGTQAKEYKWLNTKDYKNVFVHTDFNQCDFIEKNLNETIKRTIMREGIDPTISESLVFKITRFGDEEKRELIDKELTSGNKIIFYVYAKCIEYGSVYIYQFDVDFAVMDSRHSQALIYSTPRHSVMGADSPRGMDKIFRKLMKEAVDDYVAANAK